ncbi:MAG: DUF3500 domain-containing protein [Bacteroidota bacterium]|nr:DUF3500 domain-containing protein [Bacteroidota bacterium]
MKAAALIFFGIFFAIQPGRAQDRTIASKANDFLALLDETQSEKAKYDFEDDERFDWHYVPRERNGIAFKDMNENQRQAALALLRACLSEQGYQKANSIIALENILREIEKRTADDTYRDPLNYSITVFGNPHESALWGWRLEGHHISLNFSSADGEIVSSTPTFWGSNPAIVRSGRNTGRQILKQESDLGFTLVNSLNANQMKIAVVSQKAPSDIITRNQRTAELQAEKGLEYTQMNDQQKKLFRQLLNIYVKNYQFGFANRLMDKIEKAGIDNLSFAWAGSLQPGAGHYYRIQGPMLLIEYDNTQDNANHVHTVVRDLTNDFAEDILREHYQKEHN